MKRILLGPCVLAVVLVLVAGSQAQASRPGFAKPLSDIKFESDGSPACLDSAQENGDPATGPSTFILKAPSGCAVPWHYHTAEEQVIVVSGEVLTEMEGMPGKQMGPGGFAMMPSKAMHWFTCKSRDTCLMFVTFDRKYDIVWAKLQK